MASYKDAVRWIANEDEPELASTEFVENLVSVALVADLFGKDARSVAADVLELRMTHGTVVPEGVVLVRGSGATAHYRSDDARTGLCGTRVGEEVIELSELVKVCPRCVRLAAWRTWKSLSPLQRDWST